MAIDDGSILLVLPVAFRKDTNGELLFEKQAFNGLERWADNFDRLVVACPLELEKNHSPNNSSVEYLPVNQLISRSRIEFVPLPYAYKFVAFLKTYRRTRELLAKTIRKCQYLSFAIGGLIGDWASVASLEAIRQKRHFSIWTDNVGHKLIKSGHLDSVGLKRIYRRIKNNWIISPLVEKLERRIIAACDLGLFHGRDCFDAYAKYCRCPQLVHNIHLKPDDRISSERLNEKIQHVVSGEPLRLIYAGRVMGIKGPMDWVQVMSRLHSQGLRFQATWIGDGPQLAEMQAEIQRLGLSAVVQTPGFIGERKRLLEAIRSSDLFVFCHKTPESPRCLIEALVSGTPIMGYDSPYARDLLENSADKLLVPINNVNDLSDTIFELHTNRTLHAKLIELTYKLGTQYSDQAVFELRSTLIKEYT